jgi:hypothetical protein
MVLVYPSSAELLRIEQEKLPVLTMDDDAFKLLPVVNRDAALVEWEQKDKFTGLMQIRGMNAPPPVAPDIGASRYYMQPGIYGEHNFVDELAITMRRQYGSFNVPIPIDDLVMEKQDHLLQRRIDRLRWIIWTLLSTGTFTVPAPNGTVAHRGTYAVQKITVGTLWSNATASAPLADLRAALLKFRGVSASFGPNARAYMNRTTANAMLANNNPADLGGRRIAVGATINDLSAINDILVANDLPRVAIYDEGYYPDGSTVFTTFIPDGVVVLVGQRPNGETLGEFQMTRNASNADAAPGPYTLVSDSLDHGAKVPRTVRIDDGFNGGPALFFPSLVIVLTVL